MRQLLLMGLILLVSMGCADLMGPRKRAMNPEKVDPPGLPISEQEYRGRDRLAYPDPSRNAGPRTWAEVPAEQYGQLSH
jgi:hypothetical protein